MREFLLYDSYYHLIFFSLTKTGIVDPGPTWPDKGEIVYSGVSARYASDLEPVLRDIDIRFQPGEKVTLNL